MIRTPSLLSNIRKKISPGSMKLRSKLALSNLLITFLAVVGMGYYVYYRTQESNVILASQFEASVRSRAEETLYTGSREQSAQLNNFFDGMEHQISRLSEIEKNMLAQEAKLNSGAYWDAKVSLFRLPNGAWDNDNTEASSIFIPAGVDVSDRFASKLNVLKQIELVAPSILLDNPDIIAVYFGGTFKETIYLPNIDLANIVPPNFDVTGRPWYVAAATAQNPERKVVWSTPYQDAALNGLVITVSKPVVDSTDRFQGVSAMDIQLRRIADLVSAIRIGETGYAFLVDKDNRLIALPQAGYGDFGVTAETLSLGTIFDQTMLSNVTPGFLEILNRKTAANNSVITLNVNGADRFVAYQQIPAVEYSLIIVVPVEELLAESRAVQAQVFQETRNIVVTSILLVALILALASVSTLLIGNRLMSPLKAIASAANEIGKGNYDTKVEVGSRDEIGAVAETLNMMTTTIKGSVNTLERSVVERTAALQHELEKEARREKQFEAVIHVARTINAVRNLEELLPQISQVISENFNFYHVGIFLNDDNNEFAILSAANSEGGKKMLARRHQLKIGEQGIVGFVTQTGKPRIVLDVGEDANYFTNPELPDTHSEMALPLKSGEKVIGALDIQSTEAGAFTNEDFSTLSALADQVSLAIQNARLFDQGQRTLVELQSIERQFIRETWGRLPKEEKLSGYRYSVAGIIPLKDEADAAEFKDETGHKTSVPIVLRGETIGTLSVHTPKDERIGADQMDLIRAVAERVALSAENARLFDETSRRAERERVISDIASKIGASFRMESILRTTASELSQLLDDADIFIDLMPANNDNKETK